MFTELNNLRQFRMMEETSLERIGSSEFTMAPRKESRQPSLLKQNSNNSFLGHEKLSKRVYVTSNPAYYDFRPKGNQSVERIGWQSRGTSLDQRNNHEMSGYVAPKILKTGSRMSSQTYASEGRKNRFDLRKT